MIQSKLSRIAAFLIAVGAFAIVPAAWAQQPPADKADQKDPQNDPQNDPKPAAGGMVVTLGGGGGRAMFRIGGPGMNFGNDELAPVISILGELNLSPDFNLSADQKQKIQAIRDDFKSAMAGWKKDHADDLKQLDDQQKEMMDNMQNGAPPDPGQMQEMMEQRHALMDTAPNGEEHAKQVKALLTSDQLKKYDELSAERDKERQEMMSHMPRFNMGPGGPGGPGGPPPGGMHDQDHNQDHDKDKDKGR